MFALMGLCEYYTITKQPLIKKLAERQSTAQRDMNRPSPGI